MRRLVAALAAGLLLVPTTSSDAIASDDPLRNLQYGLDRTRVEEAWTRARGAGVAIAVVDTGVNLRHEDLRPRLIGGRDFVDGDDLAQDENGHGTHVAGVAAASTDNGIGIAGVAPDASVMPLRVLDVKGTGVESNVVEAVRFAVGRTDELGMRLVVNLSLTDLEVEGATSSERLEQAIREAWQAGAVVVAAAGNESLPYSDYPAAGPNVLSVGATDAEDRLAGFSNRGPIVVAPGEKIVSTYWDGSTPDDHAVYASGSGTSMAAPHVAGVAAMLLSMGMSNEEAVERIISTVDDLGPPGKDDDYGFGRVNAARAVGIGVSGAPAVGDPPDAPFTAEGRFEALSSPGPSLDERVAAPQMPAPEERPARGLVLAVAGLLLGVAYLATRWGASPAAGAHPPPGRGPGPWET